MAGRNAALADPWPRYLAQAMRKLPPVVCLLAFGASAAVAAPAAIASPAAVDRTAAPSYDPQRHDALIAAYRANRIAPPQALQQLKTWQIGRAHV